MMRSSSALHWWWIVMLVCAVASPATAQSGAPPIDLLHAIATELAVSSAYRDQRAQAERLVDGDPTTAWNSRTGDLAGAWIDVRLPADAEVTGIALIPGFARPGGPTDLFTGNHRVARIRVLREGVEVGQYAVANAAPVLVTIPVRGAGGVWRIELAEVLPGSRADWREACVSELQILGRAPSAAPGTRMPRVQIGSLPDTAAPVAVDVTALERAQRRDASWLVGAWRELQSSYFSFAENTGEPEPDVETLRETERARSAILRRITALVEPVDPARADAIRIAGAQRLAGVAWRWEPIVLGDLAAIAAALDVVAARIGSDEARCRSARAQAEIRLVRVAGLARLGNYFDEIDESEGGSTGRDAARRSRSLEADAEALRALADEWGRNSRGVTTRLLRRSAPTAGAAVTDWTALVALLPIARTSCGWPDP
ncbi:MAG: discoidin domain-containing protein [Myxococcota bacterium]|nr:discoidin domain-containing protein [Myxococcota bacterium]